MSSVWLLLVAAAGLSFLLSLFLGVSIPKVLHQGIR